MHKIIINFKNMNLPDKMQQNDIPVEALGMLNGLKALVHCFSNSAYIKAY